MTTIIGIANLPFDSPASVSGVLRDLGVSHTILLDAGSKENVKGSIRNQPARVVVASSLSIVESLARVARKPLILFLCVPLEILEAYRVKGVESFPNNDLDNAVRYLLHLYVDNPQPYTFEMEHLTAVQQLERISPPTFMDHYQEVQCKINPYALRKEAHAQALRYLIGGPKRAFREFLKADHRLTRFGTIVIGQGGQLRSVLQKVKSGIPASVAILDTDVTEFEVRYVVSSLKNINTGT